MCKLIRNIASCNRSKIKKFPFRFSFTFFQDTLIFNLLENTTISKLISLAINNDGDILSPHISDELLVILAGVVELSELVRLPVGSDVEGLGGVLATDEESTLDDGVVVLAVDGGGAEDVLAGSLETGEEAA